MKIWDLFDYAQLGKDILQYKVFGVEKPMIVVWSLTNRCNLDCDYCGLPGLDTPELNRDQIFQYLQEIHKAGTKVLSLTGGEPMVHKNFDEFLVKAKSLGMLISVNSNGILVPRKIDLLKENCFQVIISLDGLEAAHDFHRGSGSFTKAMSALHLLKERKLKHMAACVFTRETYDKIDKILEFADREEIPFTFQPVSDLKLDYEINENALELHHVLEAIDFMIKEKKKGNKYLLNSVKSLEQWRRLYTSTDEPPCVAGKVFSRIEVNGDLKKCGRVQDVIPYKEVLKNGISHSFEALSNFEDCTKCEAWTAINANSLFS